MIRTVVLVLALGSLVGGCVTTAEQQAQRNQERCAARGYQAGTEQYQDCLVRVQTDSDLRMQARRQEMLEKSAAPAFNRGY